MEKSKKTVIQTVICIGLLCVIWGGYFLVRHYVTDRIIEVKKNNYTWICQVDSVEIKDARVVIQGFAFELDKDAKAKTYEIILYDIDTERTYFPKMQYEKREDVKQYFLCEQDYSQSGFTATIKDKKVNLQENNYEILLRAKGERNAFRIGTYLEKGQVVYANPNEYIALDVSGTGLEEIVKNGVLRVYRPDHGMYVYQYEDMLYWIAESEYEFINDDIFLQFLVEPTDVYMIPKHRLNQWGWEDRGFLFSEHELIEWNIGKYRVARREIPKDYHINRIVTGNYMDGEIWREDFYPYYQLDN